jgi:hypothetical protein
MTWTGWQMQPTCLSGLVISHGLPRLLPRMIQLDDWGYPIVSAEPMAPEPHAGRAVAACPTPGPTNRRDQNQGTTPVVGHVEGTCAQGSAPPGRCDMAIAIVMAITSIHASKPISQRSALSKLTLRTPSKSVTPAISLAGIRFFVVSAERAEHPLPRLGSFPSKGRAVFSDTPFRQMRRLVLAVTGTCRQPGVGWPSVEEAITRSKTIDRSRA